MANPPTNTELKTTPLHALHVKLGARMVDFAGYDMPVQYPEGIMAEHIWTRTHAGLFDVSHMGPCFLSLPTLGGEGAHEQIAKIVEKVVPSDIQGLAPGRNQLSVLLDANGGILDDLMICRPAEPELQGSLYIIVNAGTKEQDFALLQQAAGHDAKLTRADDRALIAVQGPEAVDVVRHLVPHVDNLVFMQHARVEHLNYGHMIVNRCGYTGEDGYEILVRPDHAEEFAERLLEDLRVKPIGLGARDSLRLEAGLCLYGHDIDTNASPISGSLAWMVSKPRRERADFPGAQRILGELKNGAPKKRVGIKPLGRAPAREGVEIQTPDGKAIGVITSGGFGPTMNAPVAMGYVDAAHAKVGTAVRLIVRGKPLEAEVAALPFVPHRYKR